MASAGRRRSVSVVRIRRWLVVGFAVVAIGLAGLMGYTRYRAQKFLTALPKRLGVDIKSETNGFTYSQSVKGRTLFTIHAAKAIQRENGRTTLHDVQIKLFGPEGSHRTDSINGAEFDYDQKNGVARALGEVTLDLEAPTDPTGSAPEKRVAVTTSDLVFLQKLGVAATDSPIRFVYGDLKGEAKGAEYDSDTGVLRLRSAVHAAGDQHGQAMVVDASAAEVDRGTRIATLHGARVSSGGSKAGGDVVRVRLGAGGAVQEIEAAGNTSVANSDGVMATAPKLTAVLGSTGKLAQAVMRGGVRLMGPSMDGASDEATVRFDGAGRAAVVHLVRGVELNEQGTARSSLRAADVDAELVQEGGRSVLRDATAVGNAELQSTDAKGAVTVVRAPRLHAVTAVAAGKRYVATVHGDGGTQLEQTDGHGTTRKTIGEVLDVKLLPPGGSVGGKSNIASAVQTGHVVITETAAAVKGTPARESRAMAGRADFTGSTGVMVLTESPSVRSGDFEVAAQRVSIVQGSGEMLADGAVRGTIAGAASQEPVHITADRAAVKAGGQAVEFTSATKPARMWSGAGQMEAPLITYDRSTGVLRARGEDRLVTLMLSGKAGADGTKGPVRLSGKTVVYTPAQPGRDGRVELGGGVRMSTADGIVTARDAVAEMRGGTANGNGVLGGRVERVTATGGVHLQQPGRTGDGESLAYTAADERYALSGTAAKPARVTDSARGTVTGDELLFHGADESVEVVGGVGKRVRTETFAGRGASIR